MGRRASTAIRAVETVDHTRLFGLLRNEARHLDRQTTLTREAGSAALGRGYTKQALNTAAERFRGAMDFVKTLTGGLPESERMVGDEDMYELYREAKFIAGQPLLR